MRFELQKSNELRLKCIKKSANFSDRVLMCGFIFIMGQIILFGRLTWWDLDWDVMEPVTWFTGVIEMGVMAMAYYLFKGSEYGHTDFRTALFSWQLKRQHRKRGFSQQKHDKLIDTISLAEREIEVKNE